MQIDPMVEWQRITAVYREMYDDELINLAADESDLTEVARQVLDLELKKRGLGSIGNPLPAQKTLEPMQERRSTLVGNQGGAPQLVLDGRDMQERESQLEYTWKTPLCECESAEQARQFADTLQRAGIDNWLEGPGAGALSRSFDLPCPRILVAADQLEQARAIIENPIPQDIVDESKATVPQFEMPVCPQCGVGDPALEGAEPFNSWRCENCGYQWTDSPEVQTAEIPEAAKKPS